MQALFAALRRLSAAARVGFGCLAASTVAQDTVSANVQIDQGLLIGHPALGIVGAPAGLNSFIDDGQLLDDGYTLRPLGRRLEG
jgi:hypothetical protein